VSRKMHISLWILAALSVVNLWLTVVNNSFNDKTRETVNTLQRQELERSVREKHTPHRVQIVAWDDAQQGWIVQQDRDPLPALEK
jgi:hypothetical protein